MTVITEPVNYDRRIRQLKNRLNCALAINAIILVILAATVREPFSWVSRHTPLGLELYDSDDKARIQLRPDGFTSTRLDMRDNSGRQHFGVDLNRESSDLVLGSPKTNFFMRSSVTDDSAEIWLGSVNSPCRIRMMATQDGAAIGITDGEGRTRWFVPAN